MTNLKLTDMQTIRINILIVSLAIGVSGCSGSSETAQTPMISTPPNVAIDDAPIELPDELEMDAVNEIVTDQQPVESDNLDPENPVPDSPREPVGEPDGPINNEEQNTESETPVTSEPVVVAPPAQTLIPVTFNITVPAYQSEELSIELTWGENRLTAAWVGDEFWTASSELPTEATHLLTVTFYDRYGDLTLAQFSEEFSTGLNVTEAVQITADQLERSQFDDDGDGTSNLDELIMGGDPLLDEDSLLSVLEIDDPYYYDMRMSVEEDFEGRLLDERPLLVMTEEILHTDSSIVVDINIDAEGTGTMSHTRRFGSQSIRLSGTRTRTDDNTISWDARRSAYDGDYHHGVNVIHTVTAVDENTRTIVQSVKGSNVGTYQFLWESNTDVTAELIENTSMCRPVHGSVSTRSSSNNSGFTVVLGTYNKEVDDTYWRVTQEATTTRFISNAPEVVSVRTSEFFVRELSPFLCDFVEFD